LFCVLGAERNAQQERAAILERRLSVLREQHLRTALEHCSPYVTAAFSASI
jgi:hypothetical protein